MADSPERATADSNASEVPRRWRVEQSGIARASNVGEHRRRRRQFRFLLAVLASAGAIVGLLALVRPAPKPFLLPLIVHHENFWKPSWVPMAHNDLRALTERGYFQNLLGKTPRVQTGDAMRAGLLTLSNLSLADTVVVYVGAQARSDESGDLYFLPADADLDDFETWLPLLEILDRLGACPARNKLLLLDTTRAQANPAAGVLLDDAAARLSEILSRRKGIDKFLVLTASAPGQVEWNSEELRRSVFSYYLEEAMRGWADHDLPVGNRDGLVTARELASFAAARVDRWAALNRAARQIPVLYGPDNLDFPLVALRHGRPQSHLTPPPLRSYPRWLTDAWNVRDQRLSDGTSASAPRLVRQFEVYLIQAEKAWRNDMASRTLEGLWNEEMVNFREEFAQARVLPIPRQPRSLGMADLLGRSPDSSIASALNAILQKREEQLGILKSEGHAAVEAKLAADFLESVKDKAEFDVARAVFDAAADDPRPLPDRIRFLDRLLRKAEPEPLFVETLYLRQLSRRAESVRTIPTSFSPDWPIETIRRLLNVVRMGEKAELQPDTFAYLRPLLAQAAQTRHDGDILLAERGYAPPELADQRWKQAESEYQVIRVDQETIQNAQRARNDALVVLSTLVSEIDPNPDFAHIWDHAVDQTIELDRSLASLAAETARDTPPSGTFQQSVELLQRSADQLRENLEILRRPFGSDRLDRILRLSRQSDAGPTLIRILDAVLATAFHTANERGTLWEARSAVARRLMEKTIELDHLGEAPDELSMTAEYPEDTSTDWERSARQKAAIRTARTIALLRLAGLSSNEVQKLADQLTFLGQPRTSMTAWSGLARGIRQACFRGIPDRLRAEDLAGLDRVGRILPPSLPIPLLDRPGANPTARRRREQTIALWQWIADLYSYESADLDASSFEVAAAREYQTLAGQSFMPKVRLDGVSEALALTADRPSVTMTLGLHLPREANLRADTPIDLRILKPDDNWIDVVPDLPGLVRRTGDTTKHRLVSDFEIAGKGGDLISIPLRVSLKAGTRHVSDAPPLGFLVQAHLGGRSYTVRVPVSLNSVAEQLQILLSVEDQSKEPATSVSELRLRPAHVPQPFFLYVKNPTGTGRTVTVRMASEDGGVSVESPKTSLPPGETRRIVFASDAPKPGAALSPLSGPLEVRLVDADKGTLVQKKTFPVSISSPAEYVLVQQVRFQPAGTKAEGKNRLQVLLKAAKPPLEPPCLVDLILPPDRIPGLISHGNGTMHGELPTAPDKTLTLFAEGIQLDEASEEFGEFFLTIDGIPRAMSFITTFSRQGDATTPRRKARTDMAIHADESTLTGSVLKASVAVDNPPAGTTLQVSLGRYDGGVFHPDVVLPTFATAKQQGIRFSPTGPKGALLFEAEIADRTFEIKTTGIFGRREIQAKLVDTDGHVVKTASLPIIIGGDRPALVQLAEVPSRAKRGSTVHLKAFGSEPPSGLKSVLFFVGKPDGDKLPAKVATVAGRRVPGETSAWGADLPLPEEKRGPTEVSVQFVNNVGLSAFDTRSIELLDTEPVPLGGIAGVVIEGDRPQGDLDVLLGNEAGAVVNRTKTGARGEFKFENLPLGTYQLYANRPATGTTGRGIVTVKAGEPQPTELKLYR